DQGRALPLTTGLAHDMLERELRDVAAIRRQLGSLPADARPDVYYRRLAERKEGSRTIFSYDVTVRHNREETKKSALVAVGSERDAPRVVFFKVYDGDSPAPPP